jgi:hypothetical protein
MRLTKREGSPSAGAQAQHDATAQSKSIRNITSPECQSFSATDEVSILAAIQAIAVVRC